MATAQHHTGAGAGEDPEQVFDDSTSASDTVSTSDSDSAYRSSAGSFTETLASSIANGIVENGRIYAAYGNKEYALPIDEAELDRIDMSHAKYNLVLEQDLFIAPIPPNPQKILDLGTGTGIWAIDVAEKYPSADVLGVDIAAVQPEWVPPNCRFEIDDVEMVWTFQENSFDFVHARDLLMSIRDWPRLASQCYKHVKPGGYIELQCMLPYTKCDDGTFPSDCALAKFSAYAVEASEKLGTPTTDPESYASWLSAAGFIDVVQKRYRIPSSPWPADKRLKIIGAFELHNLLQGLEGFSMRMFTKIFGWSPEEVQVFLVDVRKDLKNLKQHSYWEFVIVYARKPAEEP